VKWLKRSAVVAGSILLLWAVAWLGEPFGIGPLGIALAVIGMVWMINLYNFMDGIDGMAASGAVFFCATAGGLIAYLDSSPLWMLLFVLGAATLGFLCFNWPPARLFMGDSGSGFYGYIFGCLAILCAQTHALSLWTWIILLGYFLADTTTTTVIRAATVPRFWGTHRSHAYQNLARVWDNHRKMTLIVLAIDLGWLLPLALVSVAWHRAAFPLALVALAPIIGFAVIYGPRYDK